MNFYKQGFTLFPNLWYLASWEFWYQIKSFFKPIFSWDWKSRLWQSFQYFQKPVTLMKCLCLVLNLMIFWGLKLRFNSWWFFMWFMEMIEDFSFLKQLFIISLKVLIEQDFRIISFDYYLIVWFIWVQYFFRIGLQFVY